MLLIESRIQKHALCDYAYEINVITIKEENRVVLVGKL